MIWALLRLSIIVSQGARSRFAALIFFFPSFFIIHLSGESSVSSVNLVIISIFGDSLEHRFGFGGGLTLGTKTMIR